MPGGWARRGTPWAPGRCRRRAATARCPALAHGPGRGPGRLEAVACVHLHAGAVPSTPAWRGPRRGRPVGRPGAGRGGSGTLQRLGGIVQHQVVVQPTGPCQLLMRHGRGIGHTARLAKVERRALHRINGARGAHIGASGTWQLAGTCSVWPRGKPAPARLKKAWPVGLNTVAASANPAIQSMCSALSGVTCRCSVRRTVPGTPSSSVRKVWVSTMASGCTFGDAEHLKAAWPGGPAVVVVFRCW